ncbi:Os05g0586800, partial [Oryza sativa Japonica Group]
MLNTAATSHSTLPNTHIVHAQLRPCVTHRRLGASSAVDDGADQEEQAPEKHRHLHARLQQLRPPVGALVHLARVEYRPQQPHQRRGEQRVRRVRLPLALFHVKAEKAMATTARTHPATCSAGTRSSTRPSWASYLTSPTRQSTPARCAARSCALTAATSASATAATASAALLAPPPPPPPADSAASATAKSSAANTYAPALMYSHRRTASAGP